MKPPAELQVHVVSHTHWDREWYHTEPVFRTRLVPLMDDVLDACGRDRQLHFLLDGQAAVLEDYLSVRPQRRADVATLLSSGRLECGPWYVLADEQIPTGEAMVRNLLAGRRTLRDLGGAAPPVLYCPDSFGHPAALPLLAAQFGCRLIVAWRGVGGGSHPASNILRWVGPDGSSALLYHLPRAGYELGENLPVDQVAAATRWQAIRAQLAERARSAVVLLCNGADHHALQSERGKAVASLRTVAKGDSIVDSSLSRFARKLTGAAAQLRVRRVSGELRDSYGYCWTLQGTFGTRQHLKRAAALAARALVRDAEPWSALAVAAGGVSSADVLRSAWRSQLLAMPHDTICGCCSDAVAKAMHLRVTEARDMARQVGANSLHSLAGYDAVLARSRYRLSAADPLVLVSNPAPRNRGGAALVTLQLKAGDVQVGPESANVQHRWRRPRVPTALADDQNRRYPLQIVRTARDRQMLESPQHYPDLDDTLRVEALAQLPAVAGFGAITLRPVFDRPTGAGAVKKRESGGSIDNGLVGVSVSRQGTVDLLHLAGDARSDASRASISFELSQDAGDLYTPAIRPPVRLLSKVIRSRLLYRGDVGSCMQLDYTLGATDGRQRGRCSVRALASVRLGEPFVRLSLSYSNTLKNIRIRLHISGNLSGAECLADAPLAVVRRDAELLPANSVAERPLATAPLQNFVVLLSAKGGQAVHADGLTEYEADSSGNVWITLLRAVGELSRSDLPERPGHAGWPQPTPDAQCQGSYSAELAWQPLGSGRWEEHADAVLHASSDFLTPVDAVSLPSEGFLRAGAAGASLELSGRGLEMTACKESEDGKAVVLRCRNVTGRASSGEWRMAFPVASARLSRLDEKPGARLRIRDGCIGFRAGPHEVVTILVFPRRGSERR